MAGDFSKRQKSDNKHLSDLTGAKFVHVDGSKAQTIVRSTAGRLLRVVIGTAGINAVIRSGSDVIGIVSTTAVGTLNYSVYCNTNIIVDVVSGTGSLTIVFGD